MERLKLNLGCGDSIAPGYLNVDNSPSVLIQQNAILRGCALGLEGMLRRRIFVRLPADVVYMNVTRGLPFGTGTVRVVYTSHMLEHLPRRQAERVLCEVLRVLEPGGVFRCALPDLARLARSYIENVEKPADRSDSLPCDQFLQAAALGIESSLSLRHPIRTLRVLRGKHYWMYDAPSFTLLLTRLGFDEAAEHSYLQSRIDDVENLDLCSRCDESFYVEAIKPHA